MSNHLLGAKEIYARWAKNYEEDIATMNWTAHAHILKNVAHCLKSGIQVFEAGAGTGALARKIVSQATDIHVSGTDISPDMINLARKDPRNHAIAIQCLDIEHSALPFEDETFEVAISCGVFEYLEKIELICSEMSRVLRNNGILSIAYESDPANDPARTVTRAHSNSLGCGENGETLDGVYFSYQHSPLRMESLLTSSGLSIVDHYNFKSAIVNDRPVHYNIITACKNGNEPTPIA